MGKKLCILSLGRSGGSVRYGKEVINHLHGVEKDAFVSGFCTEELPKVHKKIWTYTNPVTFVLSSLILLPVFLLKTIWALARGKYDALYSPYFHYWNFPVALCFRLFGKKVIFTVHDGIPHSGEGKMLEKWLNRKCIKLATGLIFLTEYVRSQVQTEWGFGSPSVVIPHGLIGPEGLKNNIRSLNGPAKLLFLGRLSRYKGIDLLLEALKNLKNEDYAWLTVAGKPEKGFTVETENDKVRILPEWQSEDNLKELINSHDILVLPYREATQSGVLMMGIAASMPMVITKVGGLVEQLENDEAIWVDPNPDRISEGINLLTTDKNRYKNISAKLIRKREGIRWEEIAEKISATF